MHIRRETTVGLFMLVATGIFFYMTFQIGVFRLDRGRYNSYILYLSDISGLSRKSEVKIAGVKVGFIDAITLEGSNNRVKISVMIVKDFILHCDAYGLIRQEGLLGSKYLEIVPGDPLVTALQPGEVLSKSKKELVLIDDLLQEFKHIAQHISEVTMTFKQVLSGQDGIQKVTATMDTFTKAAGDISRISEKLYNEVLPTVERNADKISDVIDRDFNRFATKFEQACHPVEHVVCKINEGHGFFGKLLHDEESYNDIRMAIAGVKNFFAKVDHLSIVFDSWFEPMQGLGNRMCIEDSKGYFNVRVHPADDYFYLAGYVGVTSGVISRYQKYRQWFNDDCHPLIPGDMILTPAQQLKYARQKDVQIRQYDVGLWNVQFGKIFGNLAFRFGIFDSTAGLGIDFDIPFKNDRFRWVTTLEMFDFRGRNRFGDGRPHLKWLNRIFFTQNIYSVFGADDFISKHTKNAFIGAGLRFADDDVKYLASKISIIL